MCLYISYMPLLSIINTEQDQKDLATQMHRHTPHLNPYIDSSTKLTPQNVDIQTHRLESDVFENDSRWMVKIYPVLADLNNSPINRYSTTVEVKGRALCVSCKNAVVDESPEGRERTEAIYEEEWDLPHNANAKRVEAWIREGRLTIAVPKHKVPEIGVLHGHRIVTLQSRE